MQIIFYTQFLTRLKGALQTPEQQALLNQCSTRLNGLITSMNDAVELEDSQRRLIDLSQKLAGSQIPHSFAVLSRGRLLFIEDDVSCICTDEVRETICIHCSRKMVSIT